ncbi:hypothetical protein Q1695_003784 [Nippostrongylus brasiliensis]|nr:hypothetical protein Q1695_003784 [Nippostrongylus brasiliensis]
MNSAYQQNAKVAEQLKEERFNDVRQRISEINQVIFEAIRTGQKGELFVLLHRALYKEVNAMFQLELSCSGQKRTTAQCKAGFQGLSDAIYNLVCAMWEIAEGKKYKAIKEAYDSFQNRSRGEELDIHPVYVLGATVATAIGKLL